MKIAAGSLKPDLEQGRRVALAPILARRIVKSFGMVAIPFGETSVDKHSQLTNSSSASAGQQAGLTKSRLLRGAARSNS
ncbi:hypothetical protein AAFX91_35775 [Bradyrhizobium sp. 31Argb]|uniref:hypothetical protein n=1 Tax=Bradyrhizobium sp. 31Argb TaxID=3141247 RepID=UPI00374A732B